MQATPGQTAPRWVTTGTPIHLDLCRTRPKSFALAFGIGVVAGLVMACQFGAPWGPPPGRTGPVIVPLMGYAVLSAVLLEAGFPGLMLFGMRRVGRGLHLLAGCGVALRPDGRGARDGTHAGGAAPRAQHRRTLRCTG